MIEKPLEESLSGGRRKITSHETGRRRVLVAAPIDTITTEAKTNTLLAQVDADGTLLGARIHLEDETVFAEFDKKRLIRTVRGYVKVQYELIETLPRPALTLPVPDKVHQVVALKKAK